MVVGGGIRGVGDGLGGVGHGGFSSLSVIKTLYGFLYNIFFVTHILPNVFLIG